MANHIGDLHVPGVLEIIDNALQFPELAAENTGLLLKAIGESLAQIPTERLSEIIQDGGLEVWVSPALFRYKWLNGK